MKKDLDLNSILRDSLSQANKDLGFDKKLNEATNKFDRNKFKFDKERDIGIVEFRPKEWGIKGTVGADVLDKVLESILPTNEPDPVKRFKGGLKKLNEVTGVKFGKSDRPLDRPETISDLKTVFSTLQVSSLMTSIINNNDASTAGRIFEGFISRMLGGYATNRDDIAIEDIRADSPIGEQFVSLKVIDSDTGITGSKTNLAIGITSKDNPSKSVMYLVCVKDSKNNPLFFKTFTFSINKNNFFNFICKKGTVEPVEIFKEAKDLLLRFNQDKAQEFVRKFSSLSESKDRLIEAAQSEISPKNMLLAISTYVENSLPKDLEAAKKEYPDKTDAEKFVFTNYANRLAQDALNSSKQEIYPGKTLYDILVGSDSEPGLMPVFKDINNIVSTEKFKNTFPFDTEIFKSLYYILKDTRYNAQYLGKFLDPNPENRKLLSKDIEKTDREEGEKINNIVQKNSKFYRDIYNKFILKNESMQNLLNFLDEFNTTLDRARGLKSLEPYAGEVSYNKNKAMIDEFFNIISDPNNKGNKAEGVKSESRFDIPIVRARNIAVAVEGELDDDFEQVVIEFRDTFQLAEENSKVLEEYVVPLFQSLHEIKVDLIQYYGYGELQGLVGLPDHSEDLKDKATQQLQKTQVQQPQNVNAPVSQKTNNQTSQQQPSIPQGSIPESLNKHLTKQQIGIMLRNLLKS